MAWVSSPWWKSKSPKNITQGLKPSSFQALYGTTKVVPFQNKTSTTSKQDFHHRLLALFVIDVGGGGEARGLGGGNGACGLRRTEVGGAGVDGVGVVRAEAELFEGAGVGHEPGLPALVGLELLHGCLGGRVPLAAGVAGHVMLADEGLLNLGDAGGRNGLLAVENVRPAGGVALASMAYGSEMRMMAGCGAGMSAAKARVGGGTVRTQGQGRSR